MRLNNLLAAIRNFNKAGLKAMVLKIEKKKPVNPFKAIANLRKAMNEDDGFWD